MTAMATVTVHGSKQGQYGPLLDQIEGCVASEPKFGSDTNRAAELGTAGFAP